MKCAKSRCFLVAFAVLLLCGPFVAFNERVHNVFSRLYVVNFTSQRQDLNTVADLLCWEVNVDPERLERLYRGRAFVFDGLDLIDQIPKLLLRDRWGAPICVRCLPIVGNVAEGESAYRILAYSIGPDGQDDLGDGDDITSLSCPIAVPNYLRLRK